MIPWFESPSLKLGPITIHGFGVLVAIGILVGARLTRERGRTLGLSEERVASMITTVLVVGFLMAHVFSVVAYQTAGAHPSLWAIINPFGGLSSYGGFAGALLGLWYWSRRNGQRLMAYADSLAFGLAPGWMFGRFGCFSAHDHPGHKTDFFLAVQYPTGARHDLGLDEALWAMGVSAIFLLLARRPRAMGIYVSLLALLYAPYRFFLDFLRATDTAGADPRYYGLTPAQYGSIAMLFAGIGLAMWTWRHRKDPLTS